jgi:hypothetical protein
VLACYLTIENIPASERDWNVSVRGAPRLAATLTEGRGDALLFKDLATLRADADVGTVDGWRWTGPGPDWPAWRDRLEDEELAQRVDGLTG